MTTSSTPTLIQLFVDRLSQSRDQTAIQVKRDGAFQKETWNALGDAVRRAATGFRELGVKPGDRVIQIADNSIEWIVCDLAIQMARAIHVPVHASLTAEQILEQISDCQASCIVVGDSQQFAKLMALADQLNDTIPFVTHGDVPRISSQKRIVKTLQEVQEVSDDEAAALEAESLDLLTPASIATILYTSGTTGRPKGVVLSQRNLVSNTIATVEAFGLQPTELRICFLPFSHIFARTCDLYTWIRRGSEIALVESLETILPDCMRVQPDTINGVPYFYQRVHRYLVEQGKADEPESLKKVLGGNIKLCCSGGAALPDYIYDFFWQHDVPILQGYGLTESSPVITVNSPSAYKRGTVGKPISGVDVRISSEGEIQAKGPNIMSGYWDNPDATKRMIKDGWLCTGDLGEFDDEGFLKITGRKKEIIVTAAGKNIAPIYLEELLTADPLIAQAVVIGDGRSFLTALIVPDPERIRAAVRKLRILPISKRWVLNHPKVRSMYQAIIQERLSEVSHYEQIRRFYLMDRGFTMQTREMTPKLSLKRKRIEENCQDIIESMYGDQQKPPSWAKKLASIGRSLGG